MPKRKTYDVSHGDDGWGVKARGAKRASGRFDTKAEAVERGKELAKKAQEGQLVIHKQDGTIQEERTYGNDPYPPKGKRLYIANPLKTLVWTLPTNLGPNQCPSSLGRKTPS